MALVITGGLVALGQATLISEKSSDQVLADFVLRGEVEALRDASWASLLSRHSTVRAYMNSNSGDAYPSLITFNKQSLQEMGFTGEVISAQLNSAGETGKLTFKVLLTWQDRSGTTHDEARVLIITEGGFSADS